MYIYIYIHIHTYRDQECHRGAGLGVWSVGSSSSSRPREESCPFSDGRVPNGHLSCSQAISAQMDGLGLPKRCWRFRSSPFDGHCMLPASLCPRVLASQHRSQNAFAEKTLPRSPNAGKCISMNFSTYSSIFVFIQPYLSAFHRVG